LQYLALTNKEIDRKILILKDENNHIKLFSEAIGKFDSYGVCHGAPS